MLSGRWKKGESGNPAGPKPRALCLTHLVNDYLQEHPEGSNLTYAQILARAMIAAAIKGNVTMAIELWNRVDGKVADRIAGPEGEALAAPTINVGVKIDARQLRDAAKALLESGAIEGQRVR